MRDRASKKNNGICLTEKLEWSMKNLSEWILGNNLKLSSVKPTILFQGQANFPLLLFLLAAYLGFLFGFLSSFELLPFNSSLWFSKTDLGVGHSPSFLTALEASTQALDTFNVLLHITVVFFTNKDLEYHSFHCFHSAQCKFPYQLSTTTVMLGDNRPKLNVK